MAGEQDEAQKTEDPTAKKLSDAHNKGEVPKSQEVKTWFILLAGTLFLMISVRDVAAKIGGNLSSLLEFSYSISVTGGNLRQLITNLILEVGGALLLPVIILIIAAFAGTMVQHRLVFTTEKMIPKLNKISPLKGLKRIFSLTNFVEFLKALLKLIIVGAMVIFLVWPDRNMLEQMMTRDASEVLNVVFVMALRIFGGVVGMMAIIAGLDFIFQKAQFSKQMRMTKQEVKDEMKQTDGDPQVKARLRQIRHDRARNRMMVAVPEADVVVTNPTHYAVALKYRHGETEVPYVVAKGKDLVALKIREVAEEHKVPILENPPLARTLYAGVDVDEEIHPDQYQAVAEIIGYVMRLKKGDRAAYRPSHNNDI